MSTPEPLPPAGWYPDPQGSAGLRWWDGSAWTAHVNPAAPAAPDPATRQAAPTPAPGYPGAPGAAPAAAWASAPRYAGPAMLDDRPVVRTMGDAISSVFRRYARFTGRASRSEYWYWVLFEAIIGFAAYVLMLGATVWVGPRYDGYGSSAASLAVFLLMVVWLWGLATVIPTLAVLVRRLRDAGFHWALVFIAAFPVLGPIALLVLACQPSREF